jgi:hypothetical protein
MFHGKVKFYTYFLATQKWDEGGNAIFCIGLVKYIG